MVLTLDRPAELPATTIEAAAGISDAEAERLFRTSVIENRFDQSVCDLAFRSPEEWQWCRKWRESLLSARKTLDEVIPRLEAEAAQLEAAAAKSVDLSDNMTFGSVRQQALAINPRLRLLTAEDLCRAIMLLCQEPSRLKARAQAIRDDCRFKQADAEGILSRGTIVPPSTEVASLRHEIQDAESRIKGRTPTLAAESRIAAARERLRAAKQAPAPQTAGAWSNWQAEIRLAKEAIDQLKQLAKGRKQAEKDNAADEAALIDLRQRLAKAVDEHRQATLDPANMRWPD